jgi:Fe-S cluster assembly iron-binding protein IscA
MLALTPEAVRAVVGFVVARMPAQLQDSESPPARIRRSTKPGTTPSSTKPSEGDLVIDDGPARVFVDPDTAKNLEHAELDAHVDENTLETRFIVRIRDAG